MIILKAVLLLSAFAAVTLRLFAHKYAEAIGASAEAINIIAFCALGVCLLCAVIWCVIIKKEEKAQKAAEEKSEENDGI